MNGVCTGWTRGMFAAGPAECDGAMTCRVREAWQLSTHPR